MPNQQLIDYIRGELAKNIESQSIVKILLEHQYTQQQIDEAFQVINTPPQVSGHKMNKKFMLLIIPVALIALSAVVAASALLTSNKTSPTPTVIPTSSPTNSPTSTPVATELPISAECATYYDIGYLMGLSGKSVSDSSSLSQKIPESCVSARDLGYEKGKASAVTQNKESIDSKRKNDLYVIANAIYQYAADNNGNLPKGVDATPRLLGTGAGNLDISGELSLQIKSAFPFDPENGSAENTGYTIYRSTEGRLILEAKSSVDPSQKVVVTR